MSIDGKGDALDIRKDRRKEDKFQEEIHKEFRSFTKSINSRFDASNQARETIQFTQAQLQETQGQMQITLVELTNQMKRLGDALLGDEELGHPGIIKRVNEVEKTVDQFQKDQENVDKKQDEARTAEVNGLKDRMTLAEQRVTVIETSLTTYKETKNATKYNIRSNLGLIVTIGGIVVAGALTTLFGIAQILQSTNTNP